MLLDTVILIAVADRTHPDSPGVRRFLLNAEGPYFVSAVTRVEFLGYPSASPVEMAVREKVYGEQIELLPDAAVWSLAATLRRQRQRVKLGDALIAATALHFGQPLVTRNTRDFGWIEGLEVLDPLAP